MNYTEDYYKSINYTDYLSRYRKYLQTASEITTLLEKITLVTKESKVLDFGCATGFLLEALSTLNYSNCHGYDISDWACNQATEKGLSILESPKGKFDLVFCLDVLEHMYDEQIINFFNECQAKCYVLRIPCSNNEGRSFVLDVSNKDKTHVNCRTKNQWFNLFDSVGDFLPIFLNTHTIYDSEGVLCCLLIKK